MHTLGWILLAGSAVFAVRMHRADAALQDFRRSDQPGTAYRFVPLRWRARLYTEAGQPLLARARSSLYFMYATAAIGVVMLVWSWR